MGRGRRGLVARPLHPRRTGAGTTRRTTDAIRATIGACLLLAFVTLGVVGTTPSRADADYSRWYGWYTRPYCNTESDNRYRNTRPAVAVSRPTPQAVQPRPMTRLGPRRDFG